MKKLISEITKDTFTYGLANVLGQIIGFILLPLYTSYLTTTDYGIMSMFAFISIFFTPLAAVGTSNAIFRRFNLHKEKEFQIKSLSTGFFFVLINSSILLVVCLLLSSWITVFLVDDIKYLTLVRISFLAAFFISLSSIFTVVLRAERRVKQIAVVRIVELLITVATTIYLVVQLEIGIAGVVWGGLIGALFSVVVQFLLCKNLIRVVINVKELKALINYGLPFLPHRLITYGSNFIGQYLIKEYIGLAEAGIYNIALRFAIPLMFFIGSVQSAWVPIKFQIHREEGNKSALIFRNLISFYFFVVSLLFLGSITLGPELIRIMVQPEFYDAVWLLPIVLLIPMTKGLYFMFGTGFEFTDNTKPIPLISSAGIVSLGIISWFTIDYFGIYGIIAGIISSWVAMSLMVRYFAKQRFYVPINIKMIGVIFLNAIALILLFSYIQKYSLGIRIIVEASVLFINGTILIIAILKSKELSSLDLSKYLPFGKLNTFILKLKSKF